MPACSGRYNQALMHCLPDLAVTGATSLCTPHSWTSVLSGAHQAKQCGTCECPVHQLAPCTFVAPRPAIFQRGPLAVVTVIQPADLQHFARIERSHRDISESQQAAFALAAECLLFFTTMLFLTTSPLLHNMCLQEPQLQHAGRQPYSPQ